MNMTQFMLCVFYALAVTFFIGGVNTGQMLTECRSKLVEIEGKGNGK